jgi:large subunit ribosomal protein L3
MTQVFAEDGALVPVTVLEAGPCLVVQRKTVENDGYSALQVGFGALKQKRATKPQKGHFAARLGDKTAEPRKVLKEFRLDDPDRFAVGTEMKADIFAAGDRVDVAGVSKGKGYQGAIKRHGQHRGPMSHGSKYHRGLGSMGSGTTPGKVRKGKKMAGHMGAERVTVQNLVVMRADGDKNILLLKGAVPGAKGSILTVQSTVK